MEAWEWWNEVREQNQEVGGQGQQIQSDWWTVVFLRPASSWVVGRPGLKQRQSPVDTLNNYHVSSTSVHCQLQTQWPRVWSWNMSWSFSGLWYISVPAEKAYLFGSCGNLPILLPPMLLQSGMQGVCCSQQIWRRWRWWKLVFIFQMVKSLFHPSPGESRAFLHH